MPSAIEYLEEDGKIMVCRCYGEGSFLEIPPFIDGLPVTQTADHVFADEASVRLKDRQKKLAAADAKSGRWRTVPDERQASLRRDLPEMTAKTLREIALPKTLKKTGSYAFYGCRLLQRLSLPVSMEELGSGAFVACNHLREVAFFTPEDGWDGRGCINDVLNDISYEIEISLRDRDGNEAYRLVFPEYFEESIENTPARIFIMKYEGTGFRYRQCFENGWPDLEKYDSLFKEAVFQEYPDTVMRLAADRLLFPLALEASAREEMLRWLKENKDLSAGYCLSKSGRHGGIALLETLLKEETGFFDEEMLAFFLGCAGKAKNAEAVSLLMHYKNRSRRSLSYSDRFRL